MCREIKRRGYYGKGLREIYPDVGGKQRHTSADAGVSDFTLIREAGFRIKARSTAPRRRDRYNAVNGKLKAKGGRVSLTIDPGCKYLIRALEAYSYERMTRQEHLSHIIDAATYPVAYLFPLDRQWAGKRRFVYG